MCGIAGIVRKNDRLSADDISRLATSMANSMVHRGPDDSGVWVDATGTVALSQRRLAIIDISPGGHQPMLAADGRSAITFNGEIYNFLELKADLESRGERFRSRSDTEVLLASLACWKQDALPKLDAMFAFGYFDAADGSLMLARDIFGEKPLYYTDHEDYFAFSSELHALTLLPEFDAGVDDSSIGLYLSLQYVPSPETIYRSCRKLPPGHWLRLEKSGDIRINSYFTFETSGTMEGGRSVADLADELEEILVNSLKRRLISDVPLGAFLSGGVDSSTIAALTVKKLGVPLTTFSVGFEGHAESEHHEARTIAEFLGTDHREKILSADALTLGRHIGQVLDEPNGDTSCLPTFLLSQFARESVTVALSGDGGDELFGGYGRYFATVDEWSRKRQGDASLSWWNAGDVYLSNRILVFPDEELLKLVERMPPRVATFLTGNRHRLASDPRPLMNVLREFDAANYMPGAVLPKVDRMSMQHSLEVRAPLLGTDVARFAMRLAANDCYREGQGKIVLKEVAGRYLPKDWLTRPKRGFGLPMNLWSSNVLLPELKKLLFSEDAKLHQWVDRSRLERYLDGLGHDFHAYRAWSLFILEHWLRSHPHEALEREFSPLEDAATYAAATTHQASFARRVGRFARKLIAGR